MKIKIYVINLARSPHRKKQISDQLKNCPVDYEFITAVDGAGKNISDFEQYNQNTINITGKDLKTTEIGAFLSHIKAITAGKKDNVDWAIILEDDVVVSPHFNDIINHINNVNENIDCIRLYGRGLGLAKNPTTIQKRTTYSNWGGALGYAINKSGIGKVLGVCDNFTMKIDNFLFGYWLHKLNIYEMDKNLVDIAEGITSDIGYENKDKPNSKPLTRFIYKVKYQICSLLN